MRQKRILYINLLRSCVRPWRSSGVQVWPTGPGLTLPDLHMGLWLKNTILYMKTFGDEKWSNPWFRFELFWGWEMKQPLNLLEPSSVPSSIQSKLVSVRASVCPPRSHKKISAQSVQVLNETQIRAGGGQQGGSPVGGQQGAGPAGGRPVGGQQGGE